MKKAVKSSNKRLLGSLFPVRAVTTALPRESAVLPWEQQGRVKEKGAWFGLVGLLVVVTTIPGHPPNQVSQHFLPP